jgi:hypothetical protein
MKAKERIDYQKERTYYKKIGRKYLPVSEFETGGLMEGWFLVHNKPGSTAYYAVVRPERAEIQAAMREKADELVKIIDKHMKARPTSKLTPEQLKDWEKLNEKHPEMSRMVRLKSMQDIADDIMESITGKDIR